VGAPLSVTKQYPETSRDAKKRYRSEGGTRSPHWRAARRPMNNCCSLGQVAAQGKVMAMRR
jgi:hypothetical protein